MKRSLISDLFHIINSLARSMIQLIRGRMHIARIRRPVVAIFGGKGAPLEGAYARQAHEIAAACVSSGASVLTGGGPGIMEAANCGAQERAREMGIKQKCAMGVRIKGVDEEFVSKCSYDVVKVTDFFARKWLLIHYADAVIVFPGGIGTADELFDLLNLIKTKKFGSVPIVLVDSAYWAPLVEWYLNRAFASGFIKAEARDLIFVADKTDQIIDHLRLKKSGS